MNKRSRRRVLRSLIAGSGIIASLPKTWVKPVVDSIVLPAHAQISPVAPSPGGGCNTCSTSTFTAVAAGAEAGGSPGPVGPEGSFNITVCIDNNTTSVQMVGTGNQGFGAGLEFDESMTLTVNRPDSSIASESYSSWQVACSGGAISVPAGTASADISSLFQDGSMAFICGNHNVSGVQCNANGRWAIRSFDIVVS